jgi:hypothetical protein
MLMKLALRLSLFMFAFSWISTACGAYAPQATEQPIQTPPSVAPTQVDIPLLTPTEAFLETIPVATEVITPPLSTYQDPNYGFTFDYPSAWMLDPVSFGSRAPAGYQLTSWYHEPGLVNETPTGETILNITIQLWDPNNDLKAFTENRQNAWKASGFSLQSTEDLVLANGNPAKAFVITTPDGSHGYFLFTTLGDDYLVISGNGNIELLDLVARSIR